MGEFIVGFLLLLAALCVLAFERVKKNQRSPSNAAKKRLEEAAAGRTNRPDGPLPTAIDRTPTVQSEDREDGEEGTRIFHLLMFISFSIIPSLHVVSLIVGATIDPRFLLNTPELIRNFPVLKTLVISSLYFLAIWIAMLPYSFKTSHRFGAKDFFPISVIVLELIAIVMASGELGRRLVIGAGWIYLLVMAFLGLVFVLLKCIMSVSSKS